MQLNPFAISGLLIAITCFGLIVILLRYGSTKIHRLLVFFNLSVGIWGLGVFLIGISGTNREMAILSWRFALSGGILIPVFFFHMVDVFCEKVNKKAVVFAYLQGFFFVLVFASGLGYGRIVKMEFLFDSFYYIRATSFLFCLLTILWFTFVVWGNFRLFRFYKQAVDKNKKNQILYFFFGMITGFAGGSMNFLPFHYIDVYPYGNFLIPIYCIIVTYAILKHHLMDINIVIKKGLIYSILATIITLGYLIFVVGLGMLFQGLVGYQSFIINLLAIFVFAILFNPLRDNIQHFLDKRFFQGTLESLSQERERLKQELFNAEKLAYIGRLASSIVHEIKNPLTAIKTFMEYFPERYQDADFKERFQKIIPKEVERMEQVVHQLLDLAKPRNPSLSPVNVLDTIDSTLVLLENNLKIKRINVKKEYSNSETLINGDEEQLRQVFLNLFLNSIQAMPEGGTLTVTTSISVNSRQEKFAEISVQDTGVGISEANLKKLFTPFFTTKQDGIGLGLIITQEIIKNHNGKISVESKVGEGTTFIMEVPIK